MAEAKYGRLFTEADVKLLMRYAYAKGEEGEIADEDEEGLPVEAGAVLLGWYEQDLAADDGSPFAGAGALTFPADEPLFLLRAQDVCAPSAIEDYIDAVSSCEPPAYGPHIDAAIGAHVAFLKWQEENPDRVKVPD